MFGNRKVTPDASLNLLIIDLQAKVAACESRVRTIETEYEALRQQVRGWMRRAVAAERRIDEANQGRETDSSVSVVADTPPRTRPRWGARSRWRDRHEAAVAAENGNGAEPEES